MIFEAYPTVGFNYRMTDIQAAVGREQLKRLPAIVAERRALAARYARAARPRSPGWRCRPSRPGRARNWQSYCVRLPDALRPARGDAGDARRRRQHAARHHVQPPRGGLSRPAACAIALPHSEQAQDHCILLPLYAQMTAEEQQQVASVAGTGMPRRDTRAGANCFGSGRTRGLDGSRTVRRAQSSSRAAAAVSKRQQLRRRS